MKNLLTACLPALALFALGGCAGTSALTSSEDDGVYYSSKDRTTAVVRAAPAPASASEEANPDYNGGNSAPSSAAQRGNGSTQYYDNSYTYMRGLPGYGGSSAYYGGSGLNGYAPYSPYTSLSYAPFGSVCTGYGYGWGGGAYGYSPYAYGGYDPFYSSYYSPYGYGYGSGLNISFGFGQPYYGGYGYNPYGYGYGYSPYNYGGSYYGGYYGRGGYYGNSYGGYGGGYYGGNNGGYYGGNNGGYYGSSSGDNSSRGRTYGHRTDRASEGRYSAAPAGTGGSGTPTGGHMRGERVASNGGQPLDAATDGSNRTRRDGSAPAGGYNNQPQRMDDAVRSRNPETPVATQPTGMPQEGRRRGGGFFQNVLGEQPTGNGNTGAGQPAEQPRQRTYERPRQQQQQTYEQPRQQTYEQPRQQTYEQPQRSNSQPSYSAPSNGGGSNSGGGNSGDGGRRGRD